MHPYIEKLNKYIKENPLWAEKEDAQSVLHLLCHFYQEENPIENAVIRWRLIEIDDILGKLPIRENNRIYCLIIDLCSAYADRGFAAGVQVGMRLAEELGK